MRLKLVQLDHRPPGSRCGMLPVAVVDVVVTATSERWIVSVSEKTDNDKKPGGRRGALQQPAATKLTDRATD